MCIRDRGNVDGPNPEKENSLDYIDSAIALGFNVEVDLWYNDDKSISLGHDFPDYEVTLDWLLSRKTHLWVHCKNGGAFNFALKNGLRCFVHTDESYVFTSNGVIWCYPGQPALDAAACIDVMPESNINIDVFSANKFRNFYGVCSDFIVEVKKCLET